MAFKRSSSFSFLMLLLAGCGGGGAERPLSTIPDPVPVSWTDALSAASQEGRAAAHAAALASPGFTVTGVVQSSNVDGAGVTADEVMTVHSSAAVLDIAINRDGGNSVSLSTARHSLEGDTATSPVTGRQFTYALVYQHDASRFTLARVAVDWARDDPMDYLAGGYWLHAVGDVAEGRIREAEIGAFVDGPELRGTPTLPVAGTAAYSGFAAGAYTALLGIEFGDDRGRQDIGEFEADVSLTADFENGTIAGSLDNIVVDYLAVTPDGQVEEHGRESVGYELTLDEVSIGDDGTFVGTDLGLTHPLVPVTTRGSWGGRFSTVNDVGGNPRIAAGTIGGTGSTVGGTEVSFVGGFYGATDALE